MQSYVSGSFSTPHYDVHVRDIRCSKTQPTPMLAETYGEEEEEDMIVGDYDYNEDDVHGW